jgi:hypothetical protein
MLSVKNSARSLGVIVLSLFGFLIILTLFTERSRLIYTAEEMHGRITNAEYVLELDSGESLGNAVIVSFEPNSEIENATYLPIAQLLSDDAKKMWESPAQKVLVSENKIDLYQSWVLLSQMGYENIYVLK